MSNYSLITEAAGKALPQKYLEIGLGGASRFAAMRAPDKIGVDPVKPDVMDSLMVDERILYFQMKAMEFLSAYGELLEGLDMALIDEPLAFRDAYKAITAVMARMKQGGTLFIGGCDPSSGESGEGMCRAIIVVRRMYPDWDIKISAEDGGICAITKTSGTEIKPAPDWLMDAAGSLSREELRGDCNDLTIPNDKPASAKPQKISKAAARYAARQESVRQAAFKAAQTRQARRQANQAAAARAAETAIARKRANLEAAVRAIETQAARRRSNQAAAQRMNAIHARKGKDK
ncbi:MAG: hypothetical protein LBH66_03005 [Oscillospiraceae bacterium]|jgi:hypothetical protein|nr:hypothetical protein [Oscillospiraceae bacterium]